MSRALFYLDVVPAAGEQAALGGEEGFHAATVRRIRPGEEIDLGDGTGTLAHCRVEHTGRDTLTATVLARWVVTPPVPRVTVVQALPKADRSELAVELATEAGADALVAWQARRCVARWDGEVKQRKGLRRWEAVARSAARQSRRAHLPVVEGPVTTAELVRRVAERTAAGTPVLLAHEEAAGPLVAAAGVGTAGALWLLVGPEGGIGDDEAGELTGAGAIPVRLGPTVLRTSSAAAVALGALGVLTTRWR